MTAGEDSEAENWEQGCRTDALRNSFVIPVLAAVIESSKPRSIVDLGGATGYISRSIQAKLSYQPDWTLVDLNKSRLRLAERLRPPGMSLEILPRDFLSEPLGRRFECVLMTFTLLELSNLETAVRQLTQLVVASGRLVIGMPDVWRDVLADDGDHPGVAHSFLTRSIQIPKVDKFTGLGYPFCAHRIETLVSALLNEGFVLESLRQGGGEGEAFILVFRESHRGEADEAA